MSIAALYDIHGNLPALEAVLSEVRQVGVDQIIVGGDVVPGPMPHESIACLLGLDIPIAFIRGNGEIAVLEERSGAGAAHVPSDWRPLIQWSAAQLLQSEIDQVREWPRGIRVRDPSHGDVLFCHATPRDEHEIFTSATPSDVLLPIFSTLDADLVVCGHTHMQFERTVGSTRVVNAGSVGMPFGDPGAYWLLVTHDAQLRHTRYDLAAAADRIRATNYPAAEHFAEHNVLRPPSAEMMLDAFTKAGLK
jgi:predicted phosphodiesterase